MLSYQIMQHFAAIGARLRVKTSPKHDRTRLALCLDDSGEYFELLLPRCARGYVKMLETVPREQRLILECGFEQKSRWRVQRTAEQWTLAHVAEDLSDLEMQAGFLMSA
jgi:hypothetical protein